MLKPIYNFFHRHYHARYHGVYRHAKKLFVFDLFLLGLAVLMLGASLFFFFWKPGTTDLIDLNLSIGTGRIRSGEKIILNIEYTNRSKFVLHDAILALRLPAGFVILGPTPKTVWQIGDVAPGSKQEIKIAGQLWSNIKTDEKIVGTLTYRAGNNTETEQKLGSMIINLPESVINLTANVSATAFANADLPFTLTIQNTGSETINNISLSPGWGKPNVGEKVNNITLLPGAFQTIKGTIKTPDKNGRASILIMSAQVAVNNNSFNQAEADTEIEVVLPQVFSKIEIPDVSFATPGDTIIANISIKNNNAVAIQNTRLRLSTTPGVVDMPGTAQINGIKTEGNDLIVTSRERTLFTNLAPGQSDEFAIKLKLRSQFSLTEGTKEFKITPTVESQLANLPEQRFNAAGISAVLPLTSEVTFSATPIYYTADGDQLGRGPLPPQVGATTKYYIFINFANTINNIQNVAVRATLAPGVEMGARKSVTVGQLPVYNSSDRTISWSYPELPSWSQTGLQFDVVVTPTADQIGQTINLLKDIQFSATDKNTGKKFNFSVPVLNNKLEASDPGAVRGAMVVGIP